MTDFKTKAFQENIEILKGMDKKGTITRNEIVDCERSIRLIQFGKDEMRREVLNKINNLWTFIGEDVSYKNLTISKKQLIKLIEELE